MPRPLVSIILPTLNTPSMTRACLDTVVRNTGVPYELIVVNNSRGRPIRECLGGFGNARIVQNRRNLGYTKAVNQGARISRGKFFCFLNTDTLVPPRWMERLLEAFRKPGVGAVGPVSQGCGYRYRWRASSHAEKEALTVLTDQAFQRSSPGVLESVAVLWGFCWVIPREVMSCVGSFDERFFFGQEDIDYSLRLRLHGFELLRAKSVFVHHQRSGSAPLLLRRRGQIARRDMESFLAKWRALLRMPFPNHREARLEAIRRVTSRGFTRKLGLRAAWSRVGSTIHAPW